MICTLESSDHSDQEDVAAVEDRSNGKLGPTTEVLPVSNELEDAGTEKSATSQTVKLDSSDMESNSDGSSAVESCLVGRPTRGQQAAVIICAFMALFQTFGTMLGFQLPRTDG